MSLKLEAIHHVAVIATDYARSRHFYAEILGLPVIREHRREAAGDWKIDFQLGNAELELFVKPDAPPRKSYPEAQGLRHLAFRVASVAEIAEALRKAGVRVEPLRTDAYTGKAMCFFFDPDGLPLELHECAESASKEQTRKKAARAAFFLVSN